MSPASERMIVSLILSQLLSMAPAQAKSLDCEAALRASDVHYGVQIAPDTRARKKEIKKLKKFLGEVLELLDGTLPVPKRFTIEVTSDGRAFADDMTNHIWLSLRLMSRFDIASDVRPMLAHELGHLVFAQKLKQLAPQAYAAYVAALQEGGDQRLNEQITSYAEMFCDLLAVVSTNEPQLYPSPIDYRDRDERDWRYTGLAPWDVDSSQTNFDRRAVGRDIIFWRFIPTRQALWRKHEDLFLGRKRDKRRLLQVVVESMIGEIQDLFQGPQLSDKELNRRLTGRILQGL